MSLSMAIGQFEADTSITLRVTFDCLEVRE